MTIGQKIAVLRTAMQISQEQLAEKLEVSRQSVSKWESDQSVPEVSKILQLSSIFNVTTDDLLRDEIPLAPTLTENLLNPRNQLYSTEDTLAQTVSEARLTPSLQLSTLSRSVDSSAGTTQRYSQKATKRATKQES